MKSKFRIKGLVALAAALALTFSATTLMANPYERGC